MDIDREEFYDGLLRWISSLDPSSPTPSLQWMLTGKPMAESLVHLVPECFDHEWVEKTCSGVDDQSVWRVKANGLKKLLKSILQCYNQLTGQLVSEEHIPDVQAAARDENKAELSKMLQLILALAVNGSKRQDVIEHLMKAEESVQHIVMMSIQELEERKRSASKPADPHATHSDEGLDGRLKQAVSDLESSRENNDELARRCHELDQQIDSLQDEKRVLMSENERLSTKLASNESSDEADKSKRVQNLQQQNVQLHEEMFRMESALADGKAKHDSLMRQNKELQARIDELAGNDAEYIKLKDEVDELRGKMVEAKKLESTMEMYKRKLEEMSDLRLQMKILQDKNESYMKCAIEVDEERRRNGALKTQLEAYKRQAQELESKLAEETKRADKMDFEFRRNKEKSDALQQERDRLITEKEELKHLREELKLTQFQAASPAVQSELLAGVGGEQASASSIPANVTDLREQLLNLEHENRVLKATRSGSKADEVELLSSQLEDSNRRKQELETELRIANRKVIEVEATLSDIRETQLEGGGGSGDARVVEMHRQSEHHSMEAQKAKQRAADLEKHNAEKDHKLKSIEIQLQVKEAEMKQQEAKFQASLAKAKTVIQGFEQPIGGSNVGGGYSRAEFDALRRQVQEKEKLIQRMQEEQEKMRIMKEQEERLITTSFHGMAMQLHKRSVDERLAGLSGQSPASFLARQRQVTSKRPLQQAAAYHQQVPGNR